MKHKQRMRRQGPADDSDLPEGLREPPPGRRKRPTTKQWLAQVAEGTERGIRDTPAWKEAVRKFGLKETRRRLRLGLLRSQCPEANPLN
jgi:hypothetical protein